MGEIEVSYGVSQRRACSATGFGRASVRDQSCRPDPAPLRMRLRELAASRPRFGDRRLWGMLRREGWRVNLKRVLRLYRLEELHVRIRPRKRLVARPRLTRSAASQANERWTLDFMGCVLANGRRFRILTVLDTCTREALALVAARSFAADRVTQVLDGIVARRSRPQVLQCDNGTEFTSRHFDAWACTRGIAIDSIRPGRPVESAFIESFNGRLRDECLNTHWFGSLEEAGVGLEAWRRDYNDVRPHSQPGDLPPAAFAAQVAARGPQPGPVEVASLA